MNKKKDKILKRLTTGISNRLSNRSVYLSGAIEYAPDNGIGWRDRLTKIFYKRYNLVSLSPMKKEQYYEYNFLPEVELDSLKENQQYDEFSEASHRIAQVDLRLLQISDFVVLYHHPDHSACGTIEEATRARIQEKPVLFLAGGGKNRINGWYFGRFDHNLMFEKEHNLIKYLDRIHNGEITREDRKIWVL